MKKSNPEELMQHGLHFGHKSQRVHPRAYKYIYKIENGISIIDLFKTAVELDKAKDFVYNLGKANKILLIVATKKQARPILSKLGKEHNIPYLTSKWIGGFLTNFDEMKKNIKKMTTMKEDKDQGVWGQFPKHERFKLEKQLQRVNKIYDGVANLVAPPDALFIIDLKQENNAVTEAKDRNIPTVGVADTNADPSNVNFPIPANDDAITSIEYVANQIIGAYTDGRNAAHDKAEKESAKVAAKKEPEAK